jgi:hypothetical protein
MVPGALQGGPNKPHRDGGEERIFLDKRPNVKLLTPSTTTVIQDLT